MPFNPTLAKTLTNRWKLRFWMLSKLTMGLLTGMTIAELNEETCQVVLKNRWWIHNPFGSVYWAVMSMAAEMSTGALLYAYASTDKVQFILVGMKAEFSKKVKGKSYYFCRAGHDINNVLEVLQNTIEARTIMLPAQALNESGETVAEFEFYWQLRKPISRVP